MKPRHLQTIAIISFILILLGIASYAVYRTHTAELATYSNQDYGISFRYPDSYTLTETKQTAGQTGTVVTLTEKGITTPKDGEGPTAITVAMYAATTTKAKNPLLSWVTTSPYSNFTLSRQTVPGTTTIGSKDALLYTWDGLYQGTTLAALHKGNIILFSVTYDGEADLAKRADFTNLVSSVQFFNGSTSTPQSGRQY